MNTSSEWTNTERKRKRENSLHENQSDERIEVENGDEEYPNWPRKYLKTSSYTRANHSPGSPPCLKPVDSVDQIDGINIMEMCERSMTAPPKGTPGSFNRMSPVGQPSFFANMSIYFRFYPPSPVYIHHEYEEKRPGDDFGAKLYTDPNTHKDPNSYNRHFLVDIINDSPAAKMKIQNWDEIVLLNSIFVPHLTHEDVLKTFHEVKVDGRTRFQLILRRCVKVGCTKRWEWIDTSAVLSPDVPPKPDDYPIVKEARFKKLPGNVYEMRSVNFYKIPGAQYYLDVRNEGVITDVMSGTNADQTKRICKIQRYHINPDCTIVYTAALCAETKMRYIGVDQGNKIKLDDSPFWFEVKYRGDNIHFKTNDMFLACNMKTHQTEVHRTEYMFEEFPADEGWDYTDCSVPCAEVSYGDGMSQPYCRNISSEA